MGNGGGGICYFYVKKSTVKKKSTGKHKELWQSWNCYLKNGLQIFILLLFWISVSLSVCHFNRLLDHRCEHRFILKGENDNPHSTTSATYLKLYVPACCLSYSLVHWRHNLWQLADVSWLDQLIKDDLFTDVLMMKLMKIKIHYFILIMKMSN